MNDTIPLSAEQRSLLYLDRVFGGTVVRNILAEIPLPGGADRRTVAAALRELGAAHPALRATLAGDTGRLLVTDAPITLDPPHDGPPPPLDACRRALRLRGPGRHTGPRAYGEMHGNTLLTAFDHLVCDGAARRILVRDLTDLLNGRRIETAPMTLDLPPADETAERDAWSRMLRGARPLTGLVPRGEDARKWRAVQGRRAWRTPAAYRATRALMTDTRSTPFTVVAGLLAVALWRRTGIAAGAIVTPISNRRSELVTNLVNERPIPYAITPGAPVRDLIREIRRGSLAAMRYARSAIPALAAEVPGFQAFFGAPGTDYVQLQVTLADSAPPHAVRPDADAGPYRPAADVTCTVLRVSITPFTLTIGSFYAGPAGGRQTVRDLAGDLARLMTHADAGDRQQEVE